MDKERIQSALAATPSGDFAETSKALLVIVGRMSESRMTRIARISQIFQSASSV